MDNRNEDSKWGTEHRDQFPKSGKPQPLYSKQKSPLARQKERKENYQKHDPCKQKVTHETTKSMDLHESHRWETENHLYRAYTPADAAVRAVVYKNKSTVFSK